MSASIINDAMIVSASSSETQPPKQEIESAKCECCGLIEECTPGYISRIRERYLGNWICGLCSEAVKYEVKRNGRLISTQEAVVRHTSVCAAFRAAGPSLDPAADIISVVRQILRRSALDSLRTVRSTPGSPINGGGGVRGQGLGRSESCIPTLSGV